MPPYSTPIPQGLEEQMGVMPQSMEFADAGTIPIVGGTSLQCLLCLQKPPSSPTTTTTTTANTSSNVAGVGGASGSLCPPLPPSDPLPLRNMTVVITSGSGGTGYLAVQMARALGASKIITAATGARAIGWMQSLGADVVVDYKVRDIFDVLEDNSVDAVYVIFFLDLFLVGLFLYGSFSTSRTKLYGP